MKKVLTIFIIFIIMLCITGNLKVQAIGQEANIEFDISSTIVEEEDRKILKLILSFGKFTEIKENAIIGYEAILEYDENIFENVTIKGLNGWTATYMDTTKRIVGDPFVGEENSQIAEISLYIKEDATAGETKINLNDILISTDDDNDFEYSKEIILEIEAEPEEENTTIPPEEDTTTLPEEDNLNENNNVEKVETSATPGKETEKTISTEKLPFAGARMVVYIIIAVAIIGTISYIKYKSIVTK